MPRIFFYARPVTARRDFELGLLALNEITKRNSDVEVVSPDGMLAIIEFLSNIKTLEVLHWINLLIYMHNVICAW